MLCHGTSVSPACGSPFPEKDQYLQTWAVLVEALPCQSRVSCLIILITVTAITGVCTWVGHPAWAITIDRWSTPVRHVSRITWHPPRKSVVSEYLRVITLLLFKLFTVRRDAGEIGQLRETRSSVENGLWVAPWAFISCHMFSTLTMVTDDCHVNSIFVCYITVHWESFLTSLAIWINDVISTFYCRVTPL